MGWSAWSAYISNYLWGGLRGFCLPCAWIALPLHCHIVASGLCPDEVAYLWGGLSCHGLGLPASTLSNLCCWAVPLAPPSLHYRGVRG